ncbi:MAG TPA: GYF domain-containing protein [Polyangiaceae bacterium]
MKFLCPSCKAKYQIADEKVAGRSVRMKCRKCGFVIPLSEVPPAPASVPPEAGPAAQPVPKAPPAPAVAVPSVARTPPSAATQESKTAERKSAPSATKPLPPVEPKRPAPDPKAPPPRPSAGQASTGPQPPRAAGAPVAASPAAPGTLPRPAPPATLKGMASPPGAAALVMRPSVGAQVPAPAGSSPVAASSPAASPPAPAPSPPGVSKSPSPPGVSKSPSPPPKVATPAVASPAAKAPAPAAPADLLPAVDDESEEDDGDGITRIAPGGALAEAFGALVSGSHTAPSAAAIVPVSADEWFVGINEVPVGPIKLNELRKRAMVGAVTPESLVWRDGLEAWRPLKTFPELVAVLEEGMSSVQASRAPLPAAGRPAGAALVASESDPFGAGASPGGITGPVVVTDDLAAAGLTRSRTPLGAWIAIAVALAFGVVIGFVMFSKQKPPETIVKYVEVQADGGALPGAAAVAEATTAEAPGAASAKVVKPKSGSGTKPKTGEGSEGEKEGGGLSGLKGLSGLSPGGPGAPGGTSPGSAPAGGGGQLDSGQIQATVSKYTGSVKRSCWQPALDSRDPSAPTSARVMVSITVGGSGAVQGVSTSGEPRGYPGLASCIAGRVRSWQFPATGGTTTANVPFVFAAQ